MHRISSNLPRVSQASHATWHPPESPSAAVSPPYPAPPDTPPASPHPSSVKPTLPHIWQSPQEPSGGSGLAERLLPPSASARRRVGYGRRWPTERCASASRWRGSSCCGCRHGSALVAIFLRASPGLCRGRARHCRLVVGVPLEFVPITSNTPKQPLSTDSESTQSGTSNVWRA